MSSNTLARQRDVELLASTRARRLKIFVKATAGIAVLMVTAWQVSRGNTTEMLPRISGTILPAQVRPLHVVSVARTFPATVRSVNVSPGERVSRGQLLAVLESSEVTSALMRARLQATRASERVQQFSAGPGLGPAAAPNQFSLEPYQRNVDTLKARLQELENLRDRQLATEAEVDRGRLALADAEQSLQNALDHQAQIQQAAREERVSDLQARSTLDDARLEMEQAQAELRTAEQNDNALKIYADWVGTVVAVPASPGDLVLAGNTVVQLADLSELSVEASVGAMIARRVRPHDEIRVRLATDPPSETKATISDIHLGADGTSYIVRILVPNPNPTVFWAGSEAAVVFPQISPALGELWNRLPF